MSIADENDNTSSVAVAEVRDRYRLLFEAMDEGFCIIEFFDGRGGR